jgi:hypothetical protein
LLFEGVKPTYKDVRLHAALKLTGGQGGVIDVRIYVGATRGSNTGWYFIQKVEDGRYIMRSEAPQNVLLGPELAPVKSRRVDVLDATELARAD